MLDPRGRLLMAALGFAGCSMPSYDRALWALRTWLDSWPGIGHVAVGMHRQGFDLQLTQYDERGWRATFYTTGMEHSPTSATGTGWERTPWHATQHAAWEALKKSLTTTDDAANVLMDSGAGIERARLLHRGELLEAATVAWNVVEGIVAVVAGVLASSVALVGFGVDSFVETASGAVVGWRLHAERSGRADEERAEVLERRAGRIAGVLLLGLAVYIIIDAGRRLLGYGAEARESVLGIAVTAISLVVMPLLGRAKLRTAAVLGSGALRADTYETITCAWLSLTTLAGLVLNAALGWWWADPLAALAIVPLAVREGLEGWRGEHDDG